MNDQKFMRGFPPIYSSAPPPHGAEWLAKFHEVAPKIEGGAILIFCGERGTGKTRMAYELAKDCRFVKLPPMRQTIAGHEMTVNRKAIYTTAMMLFIRLRASYRNNSPESELDIMRELSDASLVVIDELQERGETEFENQKITAILDARYQRGFPTILISNLARADFLKSVSPSVLSRIQENGGFVAFNWKSYRGANQ